MISPTLFRTPARSFLQNSIRYVSTLQSNPNIYIHETNPDSTTHILSFLPTTPPFPSLAIGTTTQLPPTPTSVTENPAFLRILHSVIRRHAHEDKILQNQALSFASSTGSSGIFAAQRTRQQRDCITASQRRNEKHKWKTGDKLGSRWQGEKWGGGRGGWVHVSDERAPPDYGRIAWPEDIFGSLEVDENGEFVRGDGEEDVGNYQESGTYRVITREGILGLSEFLRGKLMERLMEEEKKLSAENVPGVEVSEERNI